MLEPFFFVLFALAIERFCEMRATKLRSPKSGFSAIITVLLEGVVTEQGRPKL
jgi:hypothetical protein